MPTHSAHDNLWCWSQQAGAWVWGCVAGGLPGVLRRPPCVCFSPQVESRKRYEFLEMMVTAVDAHLR